MIRHKLEICQEKSTKITTALSDSKAISPLSHTHTHTASLTLYPELCFGAVGAGQQCELFGLVHGIISTGHHDPVSWPPAAHVVLYVQDHLVHHVHLESRNGVTWGTKGFNKKNISADERTEMSFD